MKILILAIVLCAAESQARGVDYNGRQPYRAYNRRGDQQVHHEPVTGAQVMSFVIRTLERLQSLYAANKWADLYQYPDLSLPLPSTYQNPQRSNQVHDMDGQGPDQDLDPLGWNPFGETGHHQAEWSRMRESQGQWGPRPPPPPGQSGRPAPSPPPSGWGK